MTLFLWSVVGICVLAYTIASFFAVRMALIYGHRGDITFAVTIAFIVLSVVLWSIIFIQILGIPL